MKHFIIEQDIIKLKRKKEIALNVPQLKHFVSQHGATQAYFAIIRALNESLVNANEDELNNDEVLELDEIMDNTLTPQQNMFSYTAG